MTVMLINKLLYIYLELMVEKETNILEEEPRLEEAEIYRIEALGLKHIEGTSYFKGEGIVISVDSNTNVTDFMWLIERGVKDYYHFGFSHFLDRPLEEIVDIRVEHKKDGGRDNYSLVILSNTYKASEGINNHGSSSGGRRDEDDIVNEASLKDRLLEQGFENIDSDNGDDVFRFTTPDGKVALIKIGARYLEYISASGGILDRLPGKDLVLKEGTRLVGYQDKSLELENDILRCEIELGAGPRLRKLDFKIPITDELFPLDDRDGFSRPAEQGSPMNIGMLNETESINNLTEINGQTIDELEASMRPGKDSIAGFLGEDESLLEILANDNDVVIKRGLTHQELARKLFTVVKLMKMSGPGYEFEYSGQRFKVEGQFTKGIQFSPFEDDTGASYNITLTNLNTGKSIMFSRLHPDMIHRYGFYEGKGSSYRLEPEDVIEIFGLSEKGEK